MCPSGEPEDVRLDVPVTEVECQCKTAMEGRKIKATGYTEKEDAFIAVCFFRSEVALKHTAVFLQD